LIDERLVLLILLPSTLQLFFDASLQESSPCNWIFRETNWWDHSWDHTAATATFLVVQVVRCIWLGIGAIIYQAHVEDDVLVSVVGFSVFGGLSLYGFSGLITGPLIATIPFTAKDLFNIYREYHNTKVGLQGGWISCSVCAQKASCHSPQHEASDPELDSASRSPTSKRGVLSESVESDLSPRGNHSKPLSQHLPPTGDDFTSPSGPRSNRANRGDSLSVSEQLVTFTPEQHSRDRETPSPDVARPETPELVGRTRAATCHDIGDIPVGFILGGDERAQPEDPALLGRTQSLI